MIFSALLLAFLATDPIFTTSYDEGIDLNLLGLGLDSPMPVPGAAELIVPRFEAANQGIGVLASETKDARVRTEGRSEEAKVLFSGTQASRWDGAGVQFLAGMGGGTLGILGGGFVGGMFGAALVGKQAGWDGMGVVILTSGLGATAGGTFLTSLLVTKTANDAYPSRGMLPAWTGSMLGLVVGEILVVQVAKASSSSVDWGVLPALGTFVVCSSAGAVAFDRMTAKSTSFSVVPWSPKPGVDGLRLTMEF